MTLIAESEPESQKVKIYRLQNKVEDNVVFDFWFKVLTGSNFSLVLHILTAY